MCLGAIYWAHLDKIYYGNNKTDAARIGFDDSFIYDEIARDYSERSIPCVNFMRDEALAAFRAWTAKPDKIAY